MKLPILSVHMITYNHSNYIAKAIEGVLMQKTNFPYQLIIGEDFSTDNTRNICEEYANKYPEKIKLLPSKKNWGMMPNYIRTFESCEGKYVALCEGDDYWIDSLKLQKQVDFLEQHQEYNICFHSVKVFDERTQQFVKDTLTRNVPQTTTLKDLAIENYIHTPSVVYRKTLNSLPLWIEDVPIGDYPILCLTALTGKIYKIEEEMAVYRVHESGAMKTYQKNDITKRITFNNGMIPFYEYMYQKSNILNFRKELIHLLYANQSYAIRKNDMVLTKSFTKKLLKEHLFYLNFTQFISTVATFFFPLILKNRYGKQG